MSIFFLALPQFQSPSIKVIEHGKLGAPKVEFTTHSIFRDGPSLQVSYPLADGSVFPFIDCPGLAAYPQPSFYQQRDPDHPGVGIISIPVTYPPTLHTLQLRLQYKDGAKILDSVRWQIENLPQTTADPRPIASRTAVGGFTVSGTAYADAPMQLVYGDVSFGAAGNADGWYWEAALSPPFRYAPWQGEEPFKTEGKLGDPQNRVALDRYPFASITDRVSLDGRLTHYTPVESVTDIVGVKAIPKGPAARPGGQWWIISPSTPFETKDGVKGTLHQYTGPMGYSGPGHTRWLMVGINIDHRTLMLKRSGPWKLDVYLAVVDPKTGAVGQWHQREGVNVATRKGDIREEIGMLFADDEVADAMNFRIRVVRRFPGDTLQFHLTLPVSQQPSR